MCDIFPQYEMYIIERNAERTASAGRLLYDMWVKSEPSLWYLCHVIVLLVKSVVIIFPFSRFINFPDQPIVWREISIITGALRSDCQDKHAQFLRGKRNRKAAYTLQHSFNWGVLMCGDVNASVFCIFLSQDFLRHCQVMYSVRCYWKPQSSVSTLWKRQRCSCFF